MVLSLRESDKVSALLSSVGEIARQIATVENFDEVVPAAEKKQLQNGVHVLDELLKQQFISRPDVRLVSDGQISGMDENLPAQPLARARVIADRLSCNAVLETTLRRYRDRVGGKYSAKDPASVAFDFRLLAIPKGTVLCSGTFDEVQQSVMENLFNFFNTPFRTKIFLLSLKVQNSCIGLLT